VDRGDCSAGSGRSRAGGTSDTPSDTPSDTQYDTQSGRRRGCDARPLAGRDRRELTVRNL